MTKIKKQKAQKCLTQKENLNLEVVKVVQKKVDLKNKINLLGQNKVNNADSLRKKCKELINNKKLILKSQERFRSERYNAYSEQLNKVASSPSGKKKNAINQFNRNICIQNKQM